jgi:hypothetical protein
MKTGTQPLRAVNRIPISSAALDLGSSSPLAGHVAAGLQINHPKGNKRLTSVLQLQLNKPKNARIILTIHHGDKTRTVKFPFQKKIAGNKALKFQMSPLEDMGGVHHISFHAYAQRKNSAVKVRITLKRVDVSW